MIYLLDQRKECEKWSRSSWLLDLIAPRAQSSAGASTGKAEFSQGEYFLRSDALQLLGKLMTYNGIKDLHCTIESDADYVNGVAM